MNGSAFHLLMILLALAPGSQAFAERWSLLEDRVFFSFSTNEGLPPGTVSALAEDASGFIWLVTQYGLGRWDGHQLESVPSGLQDVDNDTRALLAVDDRLWIATGSGLTWLDPRTRRFERIPLGIDTGVLALAWAPASKRLWLGTEDGLLMVDPSTGRSWGSGYARPSRASRFRPAGSASR
jgi:ligand-binding sensor domain-containing protein